jgi:hypothetical protein
MKNILHVWGKGAHSQSLSTKEQAMVPTRSTDEFELSDAQLEAANGGCSQFGNEGYGCGYGYGQPYGYRSEECYGKHNRYYQHYGYGHGNCSQHHWEPNSGGC